jgi:hypothetical protein
MPLICSIVFDLTIDSPGSRVSSALFHPSADFR